MYFQLSSLGAWLRARGHRVTVVANTPFADVVVRNRLDFVPLCSSEVHARSQRDKLLLNGRYGGLFYSRYAVPWNGLIYRVVREHSKEPIAILAVDRLNLWADLLAHAGLRIPVVRIQLDLPILREVANGTPRLPDGSVQEVLSVRWQSAWRDLAGSFGIGAGPSHVPRLFQSVGRNVPRIALWPGWVIGRHAEQYRIRTFGFMPLPDLDAGSLLFPEQRALPRQRVVFVAGTEGTIGTWSRHFQNISVAICNELGLDGILLGRGEATTHSSQARVSFLCRAFVPIPEALRTASAIVHHGGIGTSAAALRRGIPQLIVPRVFAQPSNAEWLRRLGVGLVLTAKDYTVATGAKYLRLLLANEGIRHRAKELAEQVTLTADAQQVCECVEALTHLLHHVGGSYSFPAGCNFENGLVTRFLST